MHLNASVHPCILRPAAVATMRSLWVTQMKHHAWVTRGYPDHVSLFLGDEGVNLGLVLLSSPSETVESDRGLSA